jgi:hypothetical protein
MTWPSKVRLTVERSVSLTFSTTEMSIAQRVRLEKKSKCESRAVFEAFRCEQTIELFHKKLKEEILCCVLPEPGEHGCRN